jgi:hypothetical protein
LTRPAALIAVGADADMVDPFEREPAATPIV